jgi:hypothetical protein
VPPPGAQLKNCAASHQAQNQSIAAPAIGHEIKSLRHQPSGKKSKHCTTSHRLQKQSIAPDA